MCVCVCIRKFSGNGPFKLNFARNCNLPPALFVEGGMRGQNVPAVGRHFSVHVLG